MGTKILPLKTELPRLVRRPGAFARAYWFPLLILLAGATADVITTWLNLKAFGTEAEAHVVQKWVSDVVGINVGVPLAKLMQLAFVLFVAAWWRPWTPWVIGLCGVLYGAAAVSNHFQLI